MVRVLLCEYAIISLFTDNFTPTLCRDVDLVTVVILQPTLVNNHFYIDLLS